MDFAAIIAIIISLLFIGFFAGLEIAFISANKLSLELNKKQGTAAGKIWGKFAEHPAKFIGTILVVFNIVLVVYGLLIGEVLHPVWAWTEKRFGFASAGYNFVKLGFETVLSTAIVLLVEFTCKAIFRARNNSILRNGIIAPVVDFFYAAFSAIALVFVSISEWILKYIFNVKINERKEVFSKTDLENFLQQNKMPHEEESSPINRELFENALTLGDVRLRECLIPRREIIGVEQSASVDDVKKLFIESKLSKLVVYEGNIDSITGYVHQLDMFRNPSTIRDILLPIPVVPETMNAPDLMNKFSAERKSIAWVVDEFGGTAGIVTMEDLLEEIFGEIRDEYDDAEELTEKQLAENEYLFSGRIELDYLKEKYGLEFPEDEDAETLSGFVIENNEGIPEPKAQIIIGDYEFTVMQMSDTRIETVKLKVLR